MSLPEPYPTARRLIRSFLSGQIEVAGDLLPKHRLSLLCICPDSASFLPVPPEVENWLSLSREGNPLSWTLRLANGLTDFLIDCALRHPHPPLVLAFENAEPEDPLDREFLAVLHRRADPAIVSLLFDATREGPDSNGCEIAEDPESLSAASSRSMYLAFYEAARCYCLRGRELIQSDRRNPHYKDLTRNLLFASLLLGRFSEVEALCKEEIERSRDPALLGNVTYAQAILNVRLYEPSRRDFAAARRWIEKSMAYNEMLPLSEKRSVNHAFLRNTLALIEMRTGNPERAEELLTEALDYIKREAPARFDEECVLLFHNRARLKTFQRQPEAAIEALSTLLRHQPGISEALLDRGLLHERAGRPEAALRDFEEAIRWSPPYPEAAFNKARALTALDRRHEVLTAWHRCLTLSPDHIEALTGRACLYYDLRDFAASRLDAESALRLSPGHARLLCLRGLLELEDGDTEQACASFTRSLEIDPALADPWANRAVIRFRQGDVEGAESDLNQAIRLRPDPSALYNRGRVFESRNEWEKAIEDYSRALSFSTRDTSSIQRHLNRCLRLSVQDHLPGR